MDIRSVILRAPARTLEEAEQLAEQIVEDYIAGTADENGVTDFFVDFTPLFEEAAKLTFLDPMVALSLLAKLCDKHELILSR